MYNYTLKHTVAKSLSLGFLYKAHQWFARLVLPPVLNQKGHLPVTSDPDQYVSAWQNWEMLGILPVVLLLMDRNWCLSISLSGNLFKKKNNKEKAFIRRQVNRFGVLSIYPYVCIIISAVCLYLIKIIKKKRSPDDIFISQNSSIFLCSLHIQITVRNKRETGIISEKMKNITVQGFALSWSKELWFYLKSLMYLTIPI